jgi:hypothetical protein
MTAQTEQFYRELNLSSSALGYLEERFLTLEDAKNLI